MPLSRVPLPAGSIRQLGAFSLVGTAAFATHFGIVLAIVPLGTAALVANALGFVCAFGVSFTGHNFLTFPTSARRNRLRAMHRLFRVSLLGFLGNEALFWLLLRITRWPYQLSLAIVLLVVAVVTLCLSKLWAFADE